MSSIVRASAAVSGPPDTGMDAEKSPRPSLVAESASACSGPTIRRASSSAASTASTPSTNAVHASRVTNRLTASSTPDAGSRASMSATPSPVDAMIGVLEA